VELVLGKTQQWVWADAGAPYTVQQQLEGSSATERWFNNASGTIQTAAFLNFTYVHQFLLSVTGAQTSQQWVNSGESVQVSVAAVLGRSLGTGQRINMIGVSDGFAVEVRPQREPSP
jgi:hypothetical protein